MILFTMSGFVGLQPSRRVTRLRGARRENDHHFLAYKLFDPISDELARQGHSVYECLAISEVFALAQEHFDAQIIAANMEEKWATEIQKHYPTLHLKPRRHGGRCFVGIEREGRRVN
jgi:hypothetical protein